MQEIFNSAPNLVVYGGSCHLEQDLRRPVYAYQQLVEYLFFVEVSIHSCNVDTLTQVKQFVRLGHFLKHHACAYLVVSESQKSPHGQHESRVDTNYRHICWQRPDERPKGQLVQHKELHSVIAWCYAIITLYLQSASCLRIRRLTLSRKRLLHSSSCGSAERLESTQSPPWCSRALDAAATFLLTPLHRGTWESASLCQIQHPGLAEQGSSQSCSQTYLERPPHSAHWKTWRLLACRSWKTPTHTRFAPRSLRTLSCSGFDPDNFLVDSTPSRRSASPWSFASFPASSTLFHRKPAGSS